MVRFKFSFSVLVYSLVFFSFFSISPSHADTKTELEDAQKLYDLNKKEDAKSKIQKLADKGSAEAWHWLGTHDYKPTPGTFRHLTE